MKDAQLAGIIIGSSAYDVFPPTSSCICQHLLSVSLARDSIRRERSDVLFEASCTTFFGYEKAKQRLCNILENELLDLGDSTVLDAVEYRVHAGIVSIAGSGRYTGYLRPGSAPVTCQANSSFAPED